MQTVVLFSLFCIFPALFCYTLESAETVVKDDETSLMEIAGGVDKEDEAGDPGLDHRYNSIDMFINETLHCPWRKKCCCHEHGCYCRKGRVRVYLTYVDACPCGPHISAIFHIRGGLIFGVLLPTDKHCSMVCKKNYCFEFCIDEHGDKIKGSISEESPENTFIGKFTLNL